jgi:hypothetical protein
MGLQPAPGRGSRFGAVLAVLSILAAQAARAEAGFIAVVGKLRAGKTLTPDEAANYSTELQRLMGKLANGQDLAPDEQAELRALGQPGSGPAPAAGGSSP